MINFKSIRKADLELGKINLIVGANSIGKSSLIQSIVGFAQFASQPSVETGVASLNGPSLNLGSARTITHHGGSNCAFEAEFSGKREGPFSQGKRTVALDLYNDFPNYDFTVRRAAPFSANQTWLELTHPPKT